MALMRQACFSVERLYFGFGLSRSLYFKNLNGSIITTAIRKLAYLKKVEMEEVSLLFTEFLISKVL